MDSVVVPAHRVKVLIDPHRLRERNAEASGHAARDSALPSLSVGGMLAATRTELGEFQPLGIILAVLTGRVVPLLAVIASKGDGVPVFFLPSHIVDLSKRCLYESEGNLEPQVGIGPTTSFLPRMRSTTELLGH